MQKLVLMDTTDTCGAFHPLSVQIFESFFGALRKRCREWKTSNENSYLWLGTFHWDLATVYEYMWKTDVTEWKMKIIILQINAKSFRFLHFWPEYSPICWFHQNFPLSRSSLPFYFRASVFQGGNPARFCVSMDMKTCSLEHYCIAVETQKPWILNYPSPSVYPAF